MSLRKGIGFCQQSESKVNSFDFFSAGTKKSQQFADLVIDSMMEDWCIIADSFKDISSFFIAFNDFW